MTDMRQSRAISTWKEASAGLGFSFTSPYEVEENGQVIRFDGYLPEFGSPNGMVFVVTSDFGRSRVEESAAAKRRQFFFSVLNESVYEVFEKNVFVEALKDWGWFPNRAATPITFRPARREEMQRPNKTVENNSVSAQRNPGGPLSS